MMRIIQINKYHYIKGGADRYYIDLSTALRARGLIVNHLSTASQRQLPAQRGDRFLPEVNYHVPGGVVDRLSKAGSAVFNLRSYALARIMAFDGPQPIAHLHNFYHQISPSILWAFGHSGVPMVMTVHDYKMICPGYTLRTGVGPCERCRGGRYHHVAINRCLLGSRLASAVGAVEAAVHRVARSYGKISAFLCPSHFMCNKLSDFGVPEDKLIHLPYFLPLEDYIATPLPAESVCAYVGRLSAEKGLDSLVRAVAMLPPGRLRLDLIGEGPSEPSLRRLAADICADRVRFLGYRSGTDLHAAIRAARFTVQPSEFFENLPYGVLEPMSLGRPVLGARIGGIPELVSDGVTGRLFDSGRLESLVEGLLWMTSQRADLSKMGAQARVQMETSHGVEAHLDKLLSVYRAALSSQRGRRTQEPGFTEQTRRS